MRTAAKKDLNHNAIKGTFESLGCYVLDLWQLGKGKPDMWVADLQHARTFFVEVKSKRGKRSPDQIDWANNCPVPTYVIRSEEAAKSLILKNEYNEDSEAKE